MAKKNGIFKKYRIVDADTGAEKEGKYFCLKTDAERACEREAVAAALEAYRDIKLEQGDDEMAGSVDEMLREMDDDVCCDEDVEEDSSSDGQKWLCKCDINWADECDFTWFEIFSTEDKKKIIALLKKNADVSREISFGTNEYSDFTGRDVLDCLEWKKIPNKKTEKFLDDFVCGSEICDNIICAFEDEDDEDDDSEDEDWEE